MPSLLEPLELGASKAPNRIFMAPMTRGRGTREHVPTTSPGRQGYTDYPATTGPGYR